MKLLRILRPISTALRLGRAPAELARRRFDKPELRALHAATGFEIHPRWRIDSWLGKILTTTTHHAMHHEKMRGNYGLCFNVWDRLMKTHHADCENRVREVTSRPRPSSPVGGRPGGER